MTPAGLVRGRAAAASGFALAALLGGCASLTGTSRDPSYQGNGTRGLSSAGAVLLVQDSTGPLSYRAALAAPGPARPVRGAACQSAITLPFGLILAAFESGNPANAAAFVGAGWGDGGYERALAAAAAAAPGARLADVRADLRTRIVLGIWRQQCVEVVATAIPARPH
jgi:hypothetical protein